MNTQQEHYLLLLRQWQQAATPADHAAAEQWRTSSPEHAETAEELEAIWKAAGTWQPALPVVDTEAAYTAIRQKAGLHTPRRRHLQPLWMLGAAAALLLLLVAVPFYYRQVPAASTHMLVATENILDAALPDGSRVWLRPGSTLEYPHAFENTVRKVRLKGEAYFEVQHNPQLPFWVEMANGSRVEVLGTAFGVQDVDGKATTVLVQTGLVRFRANATDGGELLKAGDKGVLAVNRGQIIKIHTGSNYELAWHAGGLAFVETPLAVVLQDLEAFYAVDITLENSSLLECTYTAPLTNQPIEEVLEALAYAFKMRLQKSDDKFYKLQQGSCL